MSFPLALLPIFGQIGSIALLLFGFGFVIFWHELGHFLAAKWVGIKVEQFAVGFGNAIFSWRKGVGFRMGNTQADYRALATRHLASQRRSGNAPIEEPQYTDEQINAAADEIGLGETEYRLNYIPLGGYVKMLGQDDLKPDAIADDPRAYNKKSVRARMLVISAGVIMNVILAAVGFMILFLYGFRVQPAYVGNLVPGSPAQNATVVKGSEEDIKLGGLQIGDRVVSFDGKPMEDFTKIMLGTALVEEGTPVTMVVERPNDLIADTKSVRQVILSVKPARRTQDKSFLSVGFEWPHLLQGLPDDQADKAAIDELKQYVPPGQYALMPGDTIVAARLKNQPDSDYVSLTPRDYVLFDHLVQSSAGEPLVLKIKTKSGEMKPPVENPVHFEDPFNPPLDIFGMVPRCVVRQFASKTVAMGKEKLQIGDVIVAVQSGDPLPHPTRDQLIDRFNAAGHQDKAIDLLVLRKDDDGAYKEVQVKGLKASLKVDRKEDRYGMGVMLGGEEAHAVIAGFGDNSSARGAGLSEGDLITAVADQPVKNWFDVQRVIAHLKPEDAARGIDITYKHENSADTKKITMRPRSEELASIRLMRYQCEVQDAGGMADFIIPRQTSDPLLAAKWGVSETRDFILQFYLTLRRMVGGSVSASNMMGPLGIFTGGVRFAFKGFDWLLWFLCMISANLAVVNFLPIPVVDGGQFMFLILEKIKGKPLSTRTMAIAQYVGLAFLFAVVLFVTYNDIVRMITQALA